MWSLAFWPEGFWADWPADEIDTIFFDVSVLVRPAWIFRKAVMSWRWITIER